MVTLALPPTPGTARREVLLAVYRGEDLPPVVLSGEAREPTVAEAVAVMAGGARARAAVRSWLGGRLAADMAPLSDEAFERAAAECLRRFTPEADRPAADGEAGDPYADAVAGGAEMGLSPAEALAQPWGGFLVALRGLGGRRDRETLAAAQAARAAQATARGYERWARELTARHVRTPETSAEEREATRRQVDYVRAQVEAFEATGSTVVPRDVRPPDLGGPALRPEGEPARGEAPRERDGARGHEEERARERAAAHHGRDREDGRDREGEGGEGGAEERARPDGDRADDEGHGPHEHGPPDAGPGSSVSGVGHPGEV